MIHYDSKARAFGFASFIFMMAVLSFSSCIDMEDTNKSMVLSGEWRGDFGMFYDYRDNNGRVYTFDSYDTYLTFIPAYSTRTMAEERRLTTTTTDPTSTNTTSSVGR